VWALLLCAACGSSTSSSYVPRTEVTLDEAAGPSALAPLGVAEKVGGSYAKGDVATRSVSALLAACVRPALEREPWLTGTLTYRWDVTRPEAMTVEGDLASLSAASCMRDALGRATLAEGAAGTIVYDLELRGTYAARPLDEGLALDLDVVGLDATGPATQPPQRAIEDLGGTHEKLSRCAFGAQPTLEREPWFVVGVGSDGSATLVPAEDEDAATACMRRALASARFPTEGRGYGLSVLVARGNERAEFGMIGLLNSGDAVGVGTLGSGGGGRGEGIGLGELGTIGKGNGTGFGSGGLAGQSRTKPPTVRMSSPSRRDPAHRSAELRALSPLLRERTAHGP
jgi:hypothetical protein